MVRNGELLSSPNPLRSVFAWGPGGTAFGKGTWSATLKPDGAMPTTIAPPEYEAQAHVRKVDGSGRLCFKGRTINAPDAFAGRRVALRATDTDGVFDLCYRRHVLSQVDLRENIVKSVHHVSEHPSTLTPARGSGAWFPRSLVRRAGPQAGSVHQRPWKRNAASGWRRHPEGRSAAE